MLTVALRAVINDSMLAVESRQSRGSA